MCVWIIGPLSATLRGFLTLSACPPFPATQALSLKAHTEEEYRAAFDRVDKDGSGYITLDEVTDLLRVVLGSEPTDFQVRQAWGRHDQWEGAGDGWALPTRLGAGGAPGTRLWCAVASHQLSVWEGASRE
jgi:hypothetical protein